MIQGCCPASGRHRLPLLFFSSCHLLQLQMPFLRACGQTVQLPWALPHKRGHCAAVSQPGGHTGPASSGLALPTPLSLTSRHAAASRGLDHPSLRKHHTMSEVKGETQGAVLQTQFLKDLERGQALMWKVRVISLFFISAATWIMPGTGSS